MDNILNVARVVAALPAIVIVVLLTASVVFTIAKYGLLRQGRDEERD